MIITLPTCTIHLLDSSKQLTAETHKDFQNYMAQSDDVGSCFEDIKKRAAEVIRYIDTDPQSAKTAAMNIYFTVASIENRINYPSRAFALLIDKYVLHGVESKIGHSDDELDFTISLLSEQGLTQEMVEDAVSKVKKKSIEN